MVADEEGVVGGDEALVKDFEGSFELWRAVGEEEEWAFFWEADERAKAVGKGEEDGIVWGWRLGDGVRGGEGKEGALGGALEEVSTIGGDGVWHGKMVKRRIKAREADVKKAARRVAEGEWRRLR